ncbi:unnamed protein product [Prunus brigantina]
MVKSGYHVALYLKRNGSLGKKGVPTINIQKAGVVFGSSNSLPKSSSFSGEVLIESDSKEIISTLRKKTSVAAEVEGIIRYPCVEESLGSCIVSAH